MRWKPKIPSDAKTVLAFAALFLFFLSTPLYAKVVTQVGSNTPAAETPSNTRCDNTTPITSLSGATGGVPASIDQLPSPNVVCGPGFCDGTDICNAGMGETCGTCPAECGACPPGFCDGTDICNAGMGENCRTCVLECGACPPSFCDGTDPCNAGMGENCSTCARMRRLSARLL